VAPEGARSAVAFPPYQFESGVRSIAVRAAISARFKSEPAAKRFHRGVPEAMFPTSEKSFRMGRAIPCTDASA
jgi:hypothetical protein